MGDREAVLNGGRTDPVLIGRVDIGRVSARLADEVMMMVLRPVARAKELASAHRYRVSLAHVCERPEMPVDGGKPDGLAMARDLQV